MDGGLSHIKCGKSNFIFVFSNNNIDKNCLWKVSILYCGPEIDVSVWKINKINWIVILLVFTVMLYFYLLSITCNNEVYHHIKETFTLTFTQVFCVLYYKQLILFLFCFFFHSTFSLDHTCSVSVAGSYEVTHKSAGLIETEYQNCIRWKQWTNKKGLLCHSAAPQWSLTALREDAAPQLPALYFSSARITWRASILAETQCINDWWCDE